ncbi:acyl-CoA thioesterase, partial [Escherichia coli]
MRRGFARQLRFAKGGIAPYHAAIHIERAVMMEETKRHPDGELLLRTLAMPADTNPNGDIFGGWIMSQMDIGGGIMAKELAKGRICTVSVEGMTFHSPVKVGDVVCCYG